MYIVLPLSIIQNKETVTIEHQVFKYSVSSCNIVMDLFSHLGMVCDTLLLESKADSVDICIYINNKTVQYKYKVSVCGQHTVVYGV